LNRGAHLNRSDDPAGGFARLSETLAELVARAEQLSVSRCPYCNRFDECTAQFGCVNQRQEFPPGRLPACAIGGTLNHHRA